MNLNTTVTKSGPLLTGQGPKVVRDNLDRFITLATALLLAEVKKYTPQGVYGAQGGLLGSMQSEVQGRGTPIVRGIVMSAHKYAEVIEKGRRPGRGMPPAGSLQRWIEVKLGLDPVTAKRIEFVVRRKIARRGFDGAHMFETALTKNMGKLGDLADSCGVRIVEDLNG
jgi:hypothetical protein